MRLAPGSIARPVVVVSGLALLVLSPCGFAQNPREVRLAPRFDGSTIPDPPRQREPWQPPATTLPKFVAGASGVLFDQGLADPRGCDYRAIEIGIGDVWSGGGAVAKTHGWVLPARDGEKTRFAVAWSGLVYPIVSIGEPGDPAAAVRHIAQAARAAREARAKHPNAEHGGFGSFGTNDEESAVSATSLHAIKVCLLLRLGRPDLAETVWAAGTDRPSDAGTRGAKAKSDLTSDGVSYVSMANDLAWYLFDRAVCAHMRGDDAIALIDARKLTAFRKAVETQAAAMGFDHPRRLVDRGEGPTPFIAFLDQLPELLADHERRAREPKRVPVPPAGADEKKRITALIAELDQVAVRQFGQPGGVSLGQSPIVRALVEAGDQAVGPLIEDLEHDLRLTRSVHFHRDFFRSRTIMGAHEAAYTALAGILQTSFFGAVSTGDNLSARGLEGRKAVADQVRTYWEKNRGVPLGERWYRTLADDRAEPAEWLRAAGNIVQHENVAVIPGSTAFSTSVVTELPPGARPIFRGAALRAKQNPSVAELMARRADEVDPDGPLDTHPADQLRVGMANQMAAILAEWDSKAALPVLKARVGRCARIVQFGQQIGTRLHGVETGIATLTGLRTDAGDPEALNDYAGWVRSVSPNHFPFKPIAMFEPLWRNPDNPAVIAAAAELFDDPKSPWNPSISPQTLDTDGGYQLDLLGSSLLALKSFRVLVLRALTDRTEVGTVETDA